MIHDARRVAMALLVFWPGFAWAADYVTDATRLMAAGDLASARLQLRNAVKANPQNGAAHYQLGLVDLQLGDAAAAEKEGRAAQDQGYDPAATVTLLTTAYLNAGRYRDVLRDFPSGQAAPAIAAATLVARGKAQMQLDHPDQAETSFAEARRLAPGAVAPVLGEAQLALSRHDLPAARAKVDAALKLDPTSAEALQRQSALLADQGDQAGAMAAVTKAVAAAPGQYAYRLDRAGVLIAFNQNDAARADVDAVLAIAPGNARALYFRAVLLLRAGQFAAADADLNRLSGFVSQYPGAYLVQASVKQRLGQTEQALDAASRHVARNPDDARGAALLAELQIQAKHPDKAVEVLTPLADKGTDNPTVYDLRGTAYTLLNRMPDALRDYQKALTLAPNNPTLLAHVGATQLALNQSDAAAASLGRSVGLAPAQPQAETLLATALMDSGKLDEAQKAIDQLKAQGGNPDTVALLVGGMQLARFNLPAARTAFEAIVHDHPDSAPARLGLARVALLQGRTEDWATLMAEILQRDPAREQVVNDVTDQVLRDGKVADAIAVLERAHAASPANPRFLTRLASLYIGTGAPEKALDIARDPPSSPPGAPALPALLVRAEAQVALKQTDAAQTTYRQVMAASPGLTFARVQLARLLMATDPAQARATVQEGLQGEPQNEDLLRTAVDLDAKGADLGAALASAAKLAHDPAHVPAALVLEGDLYMAAKKPDDAAKAYAASLKTAPSPRLAVRLATARSAAGHPDQAASGLREWLAAHPGDLEAEQTLSDLDINARRLDTAKTLLLDLAAKRPNDARVLNNLAWVDQQTHDPQAAALAQHAYQLAPGSQTADTWGYIMATNGGGDRGVALLRLASAQAPADPAVKYHLAVAYKAAGQPAEAVKLLTPLVAAPAEFTEKGQAKQLLATLGKP